MEFFIWSLISTAGLCYGSFLNVLIHRMQTGENILFPPSKCPKCDVPLLWWHKIPLFSYFYLNGRCYFCNKIISIQYPIVELLGMILFVFAFASYKSIVDAICVIGILSLFFVQSILDMRIQKVSTYLSFIVAFCGLIFNRYDVIGSVLGMLIGAGLIFLIKYIGNRCFNKEIFGTGDVFLFGALGSIVCADRVFLYIFYALILQTVIYLPIKWKEFREKSSHLPLYMIIFGITCLFLYIIKDKEFFAEKLVYVVFMGILLYSAYFVMRELISIVKNSETAQYCALAPAIMLASLIFLI